MGSKDQVIGADQEKRRLSITTTENFDCSTPFLNKIRKTNAEVELYLFSGIRLIGYIEQFDKTGIVFDGGPKNEDAKKQLIMRTAVASIVPLLEGI